MNPSDGPRLEELFAPYMHLPHKAFKAMVRGFLRENREKTPRDLERLAAAEAKRERRKEKRRATG